jgi:hypothetical protein
MALGIAKCAGHSSAVFLPVILLFLCGSGFLAAVIGNEFGQTVLKTMPVVGYASSGALSATPAAAVPSDFFGMHIHRATTTTPWPVAPFSSWRLWDAEASWLSLEPVKGEWHFEKLDRYVELAEARKANILLVLGFPPQWAASRPSESGLSGKPGSASEPANMEDWRNYIRTVATRYKGRIKYYEIWNEPDVALYYTGTAAKMVSLAEEAYAVLKEVDPANKLGSPPITIRGGIPWLKNYFQSGGNRWVDMVDVHIYVYPDAPEAMIGMYESFTAMLAQYDLSNTPVWNTEMGWSSPKEFFDEKEAAAYVARSYIINWALGISRFYWYAWDNTNWVTLRLTQNDCKTLTSAGHAYGEVYRWLVGNRVTSCSQNSQGIWIAQVVRSDTQTAWILWHPTGNVAYSIPATWNATNMRDLAGNKRQLTSTEINIDYSPICLFSGSGVWMEAPKGLDVKPN